MKILQSMVTVQLESRFRTFGINVFVSYEDGFL